MRYGVIGLMLSLLAKSALCPAQERTNSRPAPAPVQLRHWYGWQTFTTDGVAAGLFVAAIETHGNVSLYGSSALVFGFGAPVVHVAHHHWDYALCSLGLRVMTPSLGLVIGSQASPDTTQSDSAHDSRSTSWATAGAAIGGVAASLLDGWLLAYDEQPAVPAVERPRSQLFKVEAYPSLSLIPRGAMLGLSGTL